MGKKCSKCKIEKPISEFYSRPDRPSGLQSQCKTCLSIRNSEYRQKNRKIKPIDFEWRKCSTCGKEFGPEGFAKNKSSPTGYHYQCKICMYSKRSQSKVALKSTLKKFGLTLEQFEYLCKRQNYLCSICNKPESKFDKYGNVQRLSVDHDHKCCPGENSCGKCVRGIVCARCNIFISLAKDDPLILRNAASYLENPPLRDYCWDN